MSNLLRHQSQEPSEKMQEKAFHAVASEPLQISNWVWKPFAQSMIRRSIWYSFQVSSSFCSRGIGFFKINSFLEIFPEKSRLPLIKFFSMFFFSLHLNFKFLAATRFFLSFFCHSVETINSTENSGEKLGRLLLIEISLPLLL